MMNRKKLLLIIISACIIISIAGIIVIMVFREKPAIIMELAIYDDVNTFQTYYFTLDENGVLRSYYGRRWAGPLRAPLSGKFMVKVQSSTRTKLNEEEMSLMIHLLDRLGRRGGVDIYRSGGRWLELIYNSEDGEVYFRLSPPPRGSNCNLAILLREIRKQTGVTIEF
jgi:hypothetical protein